MLIDHGAEPWILDDNQNNALHHAVKSTASHPRQGNKLIQLIMKYKKYDTNSWESLIGTKVSQKPN